MLALHFAMQCNAVVAQRFRRAFRMVELYKRLGYDRKGIVERLRECIDFKRRCNQPIYLMIGAALFAWEKENITDGELKSCVSEIHNLPKDRKERLPHKEFLPGWEKVIDRDNLVAWRNPIQGTQLYEYKVFGTFCDITPRSFYLVQTDLEYRAQWDSGVITLEVVDKDPNSGCEVVQWIHRFPRPMYSREYIYLRKALIDCEQGVMLLMSHAVDHPSYPADPQYVRVNTYQSNMVIKPHTSFDEAGFDYILTYSDDPQTNFPGGCFNWLASSAVPDLVERLRVAAKALDDRNRVSILAMA